MPGGDKTGPNGAGPMTGRGAGFCSGNKIPGWTSSFRGGGRNAGRGMRSGNRNMYYATGLTGWQRDERFADQRVVNPDDLQTLKNQARQYKNMLDDLEKRIDQIEKNKGDK